MTTQPLEPSLLWADLKTTENKAKHHTDELTDDTLTVRRGQGFSINLKFKGPYKTKAHKLTFTASTGSFPDEKKGTKSVFGIPDVKRSDEAKAVWRAEFDRKESSPKTGSMVIIITPSADAPVGKYVLSLNQSRFNKDLVTLALLFNPWCPEDSVYMEDEAERQEYVMNESGVIFRDGGSNRVAPSPWEYGQFEDGMVEICLRLLSMRPSHYKDLVEDDSCLCNPIYVSRIVSALMNNAGDYGVLEGRWSGSYADGRRPTYWSGSYSILKQWYNSRWRAVKYGQCWVFAGVMCSVMRLLGIPCRVVSNFQSAHDNNKDLVIDVYHKFYGDWATSSRGSVWNFHVWVEAWMKRPDLPPGLDGWQVVDPTPQERSDGVFCCGPAPVKAILNGFTNADYDAPFVFAEVNADRIHWMVNADGSKRIMWTDTGAVGRNISTKSVGSNRREDLTNKYKFLEGTYKERNVFRYASYLISSGETLEDTLFKPLVDDGSLALASMRAEPAILERTTTTANRESDEADSLPMMMSVPHVTSADSVPAVITVEEVETPPEIPRVSMKFEEVSKLVNGQDVKLNLVLNSEATEPRTLSIFISVTAKTYNGSADFNIQSELKQETLLPGKNLCIPVVVPFSQYWKLMLDYDAIRVSAVALDTHNESGIYLAENDVVLENPPVEIKVLNEAVQVKQQLFVEMFFTNPVCETLKNCTLTLSGCGLLKGDQDISLPDLGPKKKVRVKVYFHPYKAGQKTLVVDFNCSVFRDIKNTMPIRVKKCQTGQAQASVGPKV